MTATQSKSTPARRLQSETAASRVSFTWLGVRRALSADQKARAAEPFDAEGTYLSAAKKLLDTAHPAFRAVTGVRNRITAYWRGMSLPYPEPGYRLIRRDRIEVFNNHMTELAGELADAVADLDRCYDELRNAARDRLGSLYDPADYPASLAGMFVVEWDFPSVSPPDYLLQLDPKLYEQEKARIAARFDEAVQLAEEAFIGEFGKLVSHLVERLSGSADGKAKIFRDSAVGNLNEFFARFRDLNVGSDQQLEDLVEKARKLVKGVGPQELRDNQTLRSHVAEKLGQVQSTLEGLMTDRPRRRVLRPGRGAA